MSWVPLLRRSCPARYPSAGSRPAAVYADTSCWECRWSTSEGRGLAKKQALPRRFERSESPGRPGFKLGSATKDPEAESRGLRVSP